MALGERQRRAQRMSLDIEATFKLAAKVTHAERRQAFIERQLADEAGEGQLQALRTTLSERKLVCGALNRELDAHRAEEWSSELPEAVWEKIAGLLDEEKALFPFALTCRRFREMQKRVVASSGGKRRLRSEVLAGWSKRLKKYIYGDVSADWCEWAFEEADWCDSAFDAAERAEALPVGSRTSDKLRAHAIMLAARHGHLETLKCWKEEDCSFAAELRGESGLRVCERAAGGGHLEVLKWARENGCPWNEWTCAWAAAGGHLEVLWWARENGCPWNEAACQMAARRSSGVATVAEGERAPGD